MWSDYGRETSKSQTEVADSDDVSDDDASLAALREKAMVGQVADAIEGYRQGSRARSHQRGPRSGPSSAAAGPSHTSMIVAEISSRSTSGGAEFPEANTACKRGMQGPTIGGPCSQGWSLLTRFAPLYEDSAGDLKAAFGHLRARPAGGSGGDSTQQGPGKAVARHRPLLRPSPRFSR